jgi:nucleotide-binding universal stress UspA family protein
MDGASAPPAAERSRPVGLRPGPRPGPRPSGRLGLRVRPSAVPERDGGDRHVLVAVDGTEPSLRAVAYAVGVARRQGLKLVVLYVHSVGMLAMAPEVACEMRRSNIEAAAALRGEIARQTCECSVDIVLVERLGSPYAEIVRLASELHVDAVVVAAGARFGFRLAASPTVRLARAAKWPVTITP